MTTSKNIFSSPTLYDGARWAGKRIGLLGGSFNPPHAGHLHIARIALAKFGLDFVWWIVTPQNPLKDRKDMAPYEERFTKVEQLTAHHPRMMATHLENLLQTNYTYETVLALKQHYPNTEFIWICGMDNAYIFHRWDRWQDLARLIPITFIARPPARLLVKSDPVRRLDIPQYNKTKGRKTGLSSPSITWIRGTKMVDISSTRIRKSLK